MPFDLKIKMFVLHHTKQQLMSIINITITRYSIIKFIVSTIVLCSLLLFSSLNLKAQEKAKSQINRGPIELGVFAGNFFISGDVDHALFAGAGYGLHARKAINSSFSLRAEIFYGVTTGQDAQPSAHNLQFDPIFAGYDDSNPWFFSYRTTLARLSLQPMLELTNLGKQRILKKYNIYLYGGIGFNSHGTKLNLKDENNAIYSDLLNKTGYQTINEYNTIAGRREIRRVLKETYDSTYETDAPKENGRFRLGNETNISAEASIGVGFSRQFSKRLNISIDHQVVLSNNDFLDGKAFPSEQNLSNSKDIVHFTSLRLAFNMGKKPIEQPEYWSDPWDLIEHKLDSLSSQLASLSHQLKDDDNDGVINQVDEEEGSKLDCPVDTRGRLLDSDNDGLVDCEDPHPFIHNRDDQINNYSNQYLDSLHNSLLKRLDSISATIQLTLSLPSSASTFSNHRSTRFIYFDSDSDYINLASLQVISEIAASIENNNISCLEVVGHTDETDSYEHNQKLGMRRAQAVTSTLQNLYKLDHVIYKIRSEGESKPRIYDATLPNQHQVNRRVEVRMCTM